MFPRGATADDPKRLLNTAINERIASLASHEGVEYLDISGTFLGEGGSLPTEIMPDLLHLSEEGYERWAAAIENKIVELGGFERVE